jgi:hypothetical protein
MTMVLHLVATMLGFVYVFVCECVCVQGGGALSCLWFNNNTQLVCLVLDGMHARTHGWRLFVTPHHREGLL